MDKAIPDALYQQCRDIITTLGEWEAARQIIPLVYAAGREAERQAAPVVGEALVEKAAKAMAFTVARAGFVWQHYEAEARAVITAISPDLIAAGRAAGLAEAAKECDRHAAFCWDEAHKGGDYDHLITRHDEAKYNAERISALILPSDEAKP